MLARAFQAGNEQVYVKTRERLQYTRTDPTPPLAEESISYDVQTTAAYQLPDRFQTTSWCVGSYVGGVKGAAVQTSIWSIRVVAIGVRPSGAGWYLADGGTWKTLSYLQRGLQPKASIATLVTDPGYPTFQCRSSYPQLLAALALDGTEPCGTDVCDRLIALSASQRMTILISRTSGLAVRRVVEDVFEKGRYVATLELYDYGVLNDIRAPQ